ncbi:hypothetical protein PGT21_007375 [Puccinia graminis f. sp. tritici]|uniref:Uncharacterized protein n=1 Tax=Puccinia graminis f. sp. tritici TaxID=56615 RepID=A0A5B0PEC4_PUCGR|nr:hypothetical protein PGT21_007375 [Puccinia graminis f. sp. tritici]KAA1123234.1 hypothetical protein PGTUg99_013290 [Puccinia graminis f. sp. tritici]
MPVTEPTGFGSGTSKTRDPILAAGICEVVPRETSLASRCAPGSLPRLPLERLHIYSFPVPPSHVGKGHFHSRPNLTLVPFPFSPGMALELPTPSKGR